jgi:PhnB protein
MENILLNPYLTFNGNCREAMGFYKKCIGGKLNIQTVAQSPMSDQWPKDMQHFILHASLVKNNILLLASDIHMGSALVKGNAVSLALKCSSKKHIRTTFSKLSEGGKVSHTLHEFFDGMIGSLTDKYGMNWILKF